MQMMARVEQNPKHWDRDVGKTEMCSACCLLLIDIRGEGLGHT